MKSSTPLVILLLACLGGASAVGFLFLLDHTEHLWIAILVPALFLLGAIPIGMRVSRKQFDLFEVLVPYWMMYLLFYGAGAIFVLTVEGAAYKTDVPKYLDLALAYCTLGFAAAMAGYAFGGKIIRPYPVAPGPSLPVLMVFVLFNVGLVGELTLGKLGSWGMKRVFSLGGIDSFLSQLAFLTLFTLFYVWYLVFARQADWTTRFVFFAYMIPAELFAMWMRIGNKSVLMWFLAMPIIAYYYARGRFPWKTSLAGLLITVFGIFPLYFTVRTYRNKYASQEYKLEQSLDELKKRQVSDYAQFSLETVARRLSIINSTAVVIRDAGTRVEYQYGRTLALGIVCVAIPRIFWPEKPIVNIGVAFARTFRLTGFGNYSSASMSMVGELYWNLHVPGIIAGMFLMGIWLRALYLRFGANRGKNPLRLAMYIPLLFITVTSCEGEIGGLFGALVKSAIIMLVIEKIAMILVSRRAEAGADSDAPLLPRAVH